jgi:hypothetical protein
MARISAYSKDKYPELGDKVIGTEGSSLDTLNYSLRLIGELFNTSNTIGVADQSIYYFQSDISLSRDNGTLSFEAGGGVGTAFGDITTIMMSKYSSGSKNVANHSLLFIGKDIILAEVGDINNFGTFRVSSIAEHPVETGFYNVTLIPDTYNGALHIDKYYILSEFTKPGEASDKNYIHVQNTGANPWLVEHNLNKFPSVTMVLSTGQSGYGDVNYVDENNLTITFAGDETGKAYIN